MISTRTIRLLYLTGVLGIVAGISISKPAVSFGIPLCGLAWLLEGDYSNRLKKLFHHPVFLVALALYALHLVGLTHSQNLAYGIKDIKTKLPLLVLPIVFFSSNVFHLYKEKKFVYGVFILSLLVCLLLSFGIYFDWIKKGQFVSSDMRTMIYGVSGVRLGMFLVFALFILAYLFQQMKSIVFRVFISLIGLFFLWFLNFTESGTGFFQLLVLLTFSVFYFLFSSFNRKKAVLFSLGLFAVFFVVSFLVFQSVSKRFVEVADKEHPVRTKQGEFYWTDPALLFVENGHVVGKNVALNELKEAWSARSNKSLYDRDSNGQPLLITLIRYMNSKHLYKDAEGLSKLSEEDVRNIENGIANADYLTMYGWQKRLHQLMFEIEAYRRGNSPFGNSLTQRIEYWRIAFHIVSNNLFIGVGTGDVQDEFNNVYALNYPYIGSEYKLRAHNQFLTFALTFGILGLLVFIAYATQTLWYKSLSSTSYLSWIFSWIILLSFLYEDTLETQSGVTFVAFFTVFFVLQKEENK